KAYVKAMDLCSPRSVKLANQFKHLVEKKFVEQRSVQYYANALNITPKHLSDTVKSVTGKTPSELIQNRILLEIKVLLRSSGMTISQIGCELNFSDQSHITRFIKQKTGCTPLELRNNL
ncbi:MAG TPA: helix-turn-helix domain-containing protein, partial [Chitinophagaceae bacterium]